ncbi:uncharacterized protein HaLaN_06006 [Haematococcus lacustris]|uniref:Uncharacterized protein n=1 Tax=Haematococcus lacustris TaxID=44745 RepID=A0A699YMW8_HAELA|nr:uncharacterized protein HaLaN_06006 [Haematococcus lacustris]
MQLAMQPGKRSAEPHNGSSQVAWLDGLKTCHKRLIHPFNPDLASEHAIECIARHEKLEAHLRSAAVECGICYERAIRTCPICRV